MREIIEWVMAVESTAAEIYDVAAVRLRDDSEFADFVRRLAEEEREHSELMRMALEICDTNGTSEAGTVVVDDRSRRDIDQLLSTFKAMISGDRFTAGSMAELIVLTEFSELNDVFLKVCDTVKDGSGEFDAIATRIQQHKDGVERFIGSRPEFSHHLENIRRLPNI